MSKGTRYLWEDRACPFCCERWKGGRKDLAMMASKWFPLPWVCKTTEGLPEALLCDRVDLWLFLPSQIGSWDTGKSCSPPWAISIPWHSGCQTPFPMSSKILVRKHVWIPETCKVKDIQAAMWHGLTSGWATRHSGLQSLIFESKFFSLKYVFVPQHLAWFWHWWTFPLDFWCPYPCWVSLLWLFSCASLFPFQQ